MANNTVINVNELTKTVNKILQEYGKDVIDGARVSSQQVAKETVKQLKRTSPKNKNGSKRGYARTWKFEYTEDRLGSFVSTIYNGKNYSLTHLLENGHYSRNGKWVDGIPHIKPAEVEAINEFEKKVIGLI